MALKITLKPHEKMILGGAVITNGATKCEFIVENKVSILRQNSIMTPEDALEFLIVGAAAVQVGTANFVKPDVTIDIIDGIEMFLAQKKIGRVADIIGTLETNSQQILE